MLSSSAGPRGRSNGAAGGALDGAVAVLREHIATMERLLDGGLAEVREAAAVITRALLAGHKLLLCGNGGSAADAQHLAAEFVARFEHDRRAYPAIALTVNASNLTAIANDYDFERVFARQVEALATPGDVLIAISTSGQSPNVLAAVRAARPRGCLTIGMTGERGGALAALCDYPVVVPSPRTARVQEAHITIGHLWCELIDAALREEE